MVSLYAVQQWVAKRLTQREQVSAHALELAYSEGSLVPATPYSTKFAKHKRLT